jgi:hypothetical protein
MNNEKVRCIHCGEYPGRVKQCINGDGIVYWALECNCKTTPYYRSSVFATSDWETITYKQDIKESFKRAKEITPAPIIICG